MNKIITLLLAIVATAAVTSAALSTPTEEKPHPHLLIIKEIPTYDVVLSHPVTVTITVMNIGTSAAHDVHLIDPHPLGESAESKAVYTLEAGANITTTYQFIPKELGAVRIGPCEVTYVENQGDTVTLKATSNYIREEEDLYRGDIEDSFAVRDIFSVITEEQYDKIHSKKILEMASYFFFCLFPVGMPFAMYKSKQLQVDNLLREARKK
eukprot:Tbor_TRINITY_DN5791_c0_g5::TRINITY_DN5791_c0_g5_i1::g.20220::m.20220/K13250/SSR2; translocon-associated protein subunit beta